MRVIVVKRASRVYIATHEGSMRVQKNTRGDKWLVCKDFTDEEKERQETPKDFEVYEYPTDECYLIVD